VQLKKKHVKCFLEDFRFAQNTLIGAGRLQNFFPTFNLAARRSRVIIILATY
jgi:hypothetical protein